MVTLPTGMAPIWHLTIDQYHSMITSGILVADDPVELLEGILVQKAQKPSTLDQYLRDPPGA